MFGGGQCRCDIGIRVSAAVGLGLRNCLAGLQNVLSLTSLGLETLTLTFGGSLLYETLVLHTWRSLGGRRCELSLEQEAHFADLP